MPAKTYFPFFFLTSMWAVGRSKTKIDIPLALGLCLCMPLLGLDPAFLSLGQDSTQESPSPQWTWSTAAQLSEQRPLPSGDFFNKKYPALHKVHAVTFIPLKSFKKALQMIDFDFTKFLPSAFPGQETPYPHPSWV